MEETIVSFQVAKLAKEKGFNIPTIQYYTPKGYCTESADYMTERYAESNWNNGQGSYPTKAEDVSCSAPTQSLLQKFIRENRGVHIEIHRNASGYYWSMCKADGGTDLGWSDTSGPNDSGEWDSFESAFSNALQVQLSYDLPNDITIIKHWGNYVEFALKSK